jgi:hypothetical protein
VRGITVASGGLFHTAGSCNRTRFDTGSISTTKRRKRSAPTIPPKPTASMRSGHGMRSSGITIA